LAFWGGIPRRNKELQSAEEFSRESTRINANQRESTRMNANEHELEQRK
jgi:hypothetical protein